MKKFSILLIAVGIVFLGFGGYELLQSQQAQNDSLVEAKTLLDESKTIENNKTNNNTAPDDFKPSPGETAGILHIPKLESDLPIVEGTHEDELAKGVGHYSGTAYPQQDDQIVLSGHRDTVFRRMGELELGDILTVQLPYGDFSYEIVETQIVDADDRSIIVPTGEEVLTLTTCYPFSYVGNAPDRYIITAVPIAENN
ncbi:class D sortase [Virgibacillus sp. NKC19-16]|uniref:class D sortase n=1 Tax=Virgibacillus salidurans TaxID=2831673 RepID=UPI001F3A16D2|nr:class D sortase [Virgibacillus sp. NKC19-16]UJL45364.1 class D sortase [Virgibacillus sp. NKC19-16]